MFLFYGLCLPYSCASYESSTYWLKYRRLYSRKLWLMAVSAAWPHAIGGVSAVGGGSAKSAWLATDGGIEEMRG
jgi:hypothetical protein